MHKKDVMPTDDELKLASQHKSINLPITVQQEIIKTALKTIIIADQNLREEKRNQILKCKVYSRKLINY